jgi:hypothetical protein
MSDSIARQSEQMSELLIVLNSEFSHERLYEKLVEIYIKIGFVVKQLLLHLIRIALKIIIR